MPTRNGIRVSKGIYFIILLVIVALCVFAPAYALCN